MFNNLNLYYNTLKYIKFKQVYHRLLNTLSNTFFNRNYSKKLPLSVQPLVWNNTIAFENSFIADTTFTFLNISHQFKNDIDWNYADFGKLWTYNLNYFDFLNQKEISTQSGLALIEDYCKNSNNLKDGLEPYPISLRGMNWIKFLSGNTISDKDIDQTLYNHYQTLSHHFEYHLLGNHLLENGFSLFFASYYFRNDKWYKKAQNILKTELKEQIKSDGAHFELSPMYHQILLLRMLDCINLVKLNPWMHDDLLYFLKEKAVKMLSWLESVTYKNGDIPMVNDAAYGIAPTSAELFDYARSIGLSWEKAQLNDSGYRKFTGTDYECFIDVGNIGPDYIPGHAHADTFNFELHVNKKPCIIDLGTSTYEKNDLRQSERSTTAHNTVVVDHKNQSEVWGGFRVGKRAKVISLIEKENEILASHDGYKNIGVTHARSFRRRKNEILIKDTLSVNRFENVAYFHLHPSITETLVTKETIDATQHGFKLKFSGENIQINKASYNYALGFNKTEKAIVFGVSFKNELVTSISIDC